MRRLISISIVALLTVSVAAGQTLTFDSPVPGTILDKNGLGTGFLVRMPGTGSAFSGGDPNLDLLSNPGHLTITSTQAQFNYNGVNLPQLEAFGFFLPAIGTGDFKISALFRDIHLSGYSDQLMLYAGSSSSEIVRAGLHMDTIGMTGSIVGNNGGLDDPVRMFMSQGGVATDGDDVQLTFGRSNGEWSLQWQNLTQPSGSGSSPSFSLPWLDSSTDLYVGIHYGNPGNANPKTTQVEWLSVTPEPATLMLLALSGLMSMRRRRHACAASATLDVTG